MHAIYLHPLRPYGHHSSRVSLVFQMLSLESFEYKTRESVFNTVSTSLSNVNNLCLELSVTMLQTWSCLFLQSSNNYDVLTFQYNYSFQTEEQALSTFQNFNFSSKYNGM